MDFDEFRLNRLIPRAPVVIAIIGSLIGALFIGSWVGSGQFSKIYVIIAGAAVATVVMQLGSKYWLLIPFSFTFQLPALPFGQRSFELPEIIITICTATFIARYALKQQKFTLFRGEHVPVQLYIGWAAMIFFIHPVGLAQGGAAVAGARYYAKLAMAFASFLIMANQKFTMRDCKWILTLIVTGSFFYCVQNIFLFFFGHQYAGASAAALVDPDTYYSWHQNLVIVPLVVVPMVFARYRSSEIFSLRRPWIPLVLGVCVLVTLVSGKRAGIISIPVCAVAAAIIRKEWGYLIFWVAGGVVAASIVIMGQDNVFKLPLTVQRTLSWLPARWDASLAGYELGADPFRKRMNELAMDRIQRDPWIGRGYEVDLKMVNQVVGLGENSLESICVSMAIGAQWHNAWLGVAADFGIPAAVFQAIIYLQVSLLGLWLFKRLPPSSMTHTLAFYILLYNIRDLASSWHGGQSATGPFDRYWMYGMLVSLVVMAKSNMTATHHAEAPVIPRDGFDRALPGRSRERLPRPVLRRSAPEM